VTGKLDVREAAVRLPAEVTSEPESAAMGFGEEFEPAADEEAAA